MSGDYSRVRFNPRNHYSGVKMQQGRVQLDSDWNEWADALERRTRAETVDTFGVSPTPGISGVAVVSPQTPDAFLVELNAGELSIGAGRMYVDGLLAENFGAPDGAQHFDPVLAEQRGIAPRAYADQPYHPAPAPLPESGTQLAYLEVWQREVTHLQQPNLVEQAIGVDTTTRTQTVWQVRLLDDIPDAISCSSPDADLGPAWATLTSPSAGRLSSRDAGVPGDNDPCELPPSGGYRGLENQLYRIEIHDGGAVGSATFKWSRDNASVAAAVVEVVSASELKLASMGRDSVLRFNSGDWVEITDDWRELSGTAGDPARRHGEMRNITVDDAKQTISFSPALPADMIPAELGSDTLELRHLRVTRWDQKGVVRDSDDNIIVDLDAPGSNGIISVPGPGVWVNLENGVQVRFAREPGTGSFRCNDYWNVAARTSDASVELLADAPPLGIHRHYARLARVTFPDGETDCRKHWPPDCGGGCCTFTVSPGDDIQAAIDALPGEGGCICLKTGVHIIREPLRITASNISLHGESPGAIVRAPGALPWMLQIGDPDLSARDIEVLDIRFEARGVPDSQGVCLLYLNHCAAVRIAQCELEVALKQPAPYIGILMRNVRDVVVSDNRLDNFYEGIRVRDYYDRLAIEDNVISGMSAAIEGVESAFGSLGVAVDNDFVAPCRIERNRINQFWSGVALGDGARGSSVAHNQFQRAGQLSVDQSFPENMESLRAYMDALYFAIDINASHCRVEHNLIDLPASLWGGVRIAAEHTLVAGNILRATVKASPLTPLPGSIYCRGHAEEGSAAHHGKLIGNRLLGPQTGIVVSRADGVTVEDNFIEGDGAGWFGARLGDCNSARVRNNTAADLFFGFFVSGGLGNHTCANHMCECGIGITATAENHLDIDNNELVACAFTGIMAYVTATARISGNRLLNCGYSDTSSLGIAVFANQLYSESESMVRIEGNEVLDTGVNPVTNKASAAVSVGIAAVCASCTVSHNHTNYTQDVLARALEHRALMLVGPYALRYTTGDITLELMVGSAVVNDNRFRGPGRSHLVEFAQNNITDNIDLRFDKVTFNNNVCEHLGAEPLDDTATVRLWGGKLIAMGNHVKADGKVNAMSLGNRKQVALMGNITSGKYIRVGTTTPAPLTSFNIQT